MTLTTNYLEMLAPPSDTHLSDLLQPPEGIGEVDVSQRSSISTSEYCDLYRRVGGEWNWVRRLQMSEAELAAWLALENVEVWVLTVDGVDAGYCELDRRTPDAEIVYFGLFPEFVGRGLGKLFLNWMIHQAWTNGTKRLWLHTCSNDHPAALPNYLQAGFTIYKVETDAG